MEWLRKNLALALGVGMPVALVVFFMLASWIPRLLVAPPAYDLLFLVNNNGFQPNNSLHDEVRGQHLTFTFVGQNFGYNWPKLYHYSAATGAVKEIPIEVPAELHTHPGTPAPNPGETVTPVPVPEVDNLHVDSSNTAPDGYVFSMAVNSPELLGSLFYSRSHTMATISKDGSVVKITPPGTNNIYYYMNNVKFVGWILP